MPGSLWLALVPVLLLNAISSAQNGENHPPLRVGIVGLVHGHVHGFLSSPATVLRSKSSASLTRIGSYSRRPLQSTALIRRNSSPMWTR